MLVAQNATLSLWEENLEQLSADEEERNWEDELEVLSARLQEPVNINTATKRQLEEFPFLTDIQIENILAYVYINGQMQTLMSCSWWRRWTGRLSNCCYPSSA